MGRIRMNRRLSIRMNGRFVGTWQFGRESRFIYNKLWLKSPQARPISLSMPITGTDAAYTGPVVDAFFDNLLPDSETIRRRLQSRFGTRTTGAFDLLSEIGRDCVGALQLLPEGDEPTEVKTIRSEPLSEKDMALALRHQAADSTFGISDTSGEFRISLAGAQEKTAFLFHDGRWHRPLGSTPTTHIFKRPLGRIGLEGIDLSTSLENEWLCLRILSGFGIPVAPSRIETFEDEKALIVERFDRRLAQDGTWWIRLPQEDFCQVTGTSPGLKYQSDGGPAIRDIAGILNGSVFAEDDKKTFFKSQILFWILAAPDGHAKNFSIFLLPEGRFRMTPLYDVISAYPVLGKGSGLIHPTKLKMAMALKGSRGNRYEWDRMSGRHWISTARDAGLSKATVEEILSDIVDAAPAVVNDADLNLPSGFPESVSGPILEGVERNMRRMEL